jgi:histidinol-phosphate/aromatic aminotransferase/cobyric acid decarboxylase-like protein
MTAQKASGNAHMTPSAWDMSVQQYHGGQEWQLDNYLEDFSVTTNGLGTPAAAMEVAKQALMTIAHYPAANQEPALSSLANFMWPADNQQRGHKQRLLLGNGASELIDLVVRISPEGAWKPGPSVVQYKEYERSGMIGRLIDQCSRVLASAHGRVILSRNASAPAAVFSLVNPTNPTGDYMDLATIKAWIEENVNDGAVVTVDESMQLWLGPEWRQDSLVSQADWIRSLYERRGIAVFVIHSWTKIWSCCGVRLGSIVCPTSEHCMQLRRLQVPWSLNTPALAFLDAVVKDEAYMEETWSVTTPWRAYAVDALTKLCGGQWELNGAPFLSWIWIDMRSAETAERAVSLAKQGTF